MARDRVSCYSCLAWLPMGGKVYDNVRMHHSNRQLKILTKKKGQFRGYFHKSNKYMII